MGRNIQKGLWLALAAVLALVYRRHASTHEVAPEAVRAERVATSAPPPGAHRLPTPIAAPPMIRPFRSSLRACHLRGRITNPGKEVDNLNLDVFRKVARSNELLDVDNTGEVVPDGSFDVELPPGDYFIFAHDEERSSALAGPFTLGLGEEVSEVELTLEGSVHTEGLVIDEKGDPTEASLDVLVGDGTWRMHLAQRVESDGAFELDELPHERLQLTAVNDETGRQARMVLAAPERGLTLRLTENARRLTIHVTDAQGAPAAEVGVSVTVLGTDDDATTTTHGNADDKGDFIAYPPGQHVRVEVDNTAGIADAVDLELDGDRELEIALRAGATLRGRVILADGRVSRSQIGLVGVDRGAETSGYMSLDEDGGFEWNRLRAGNYVIVTTFMSQGDELTVEEAQARYQQGAQGLGGVLAEVRLAEGETRDLGDLRLAPEGTIRGVVRAEDGSPMSDAMIEHINGSDENDTGVHTDAEGRFELHGLVGSHHLRAMKDGDFSNVVTAQVGDTNVALTVRSLGEVIGIVHGMPAGSAWARCADDVWKELGDDGSIHLSCMVGSTMEVAAAGDTHHYAVNVDPTETSYFELNW